MTRARAAADLRDAEAIRTGQERATQQLAHFYDSVLPKGQEGARRITYRRLAALADESNLDYDRRTIAINQLRESALEQMDVTMVLEGEYRDVRRFIHKLETAPEFVVIENVGLVQGEKNAPLTLTVKLSTYYKAVCDGAGPAHTLDPARRPRCRSRRGRLLRADAGAGDAGRSGQTGRGRGPWRPGAKPAPRPIDVRLDALGKAAAAEYPEAARRNPFRMGAARRHRRRKARWPHARRRSRSRRWSWRRWGRRHRHRFRTGSSACSRACRDRDASPC